MPDPITVRTARRWAGEPAACASASASGPRRATRGAPQLAPLFHIHGVVFSAWIVLLVVQTRLIAAGRTALHRRLGVGSGMLAVAMVIAGLTAAVAAARRGTPPDAIAGLPPPLVFLVIPFTDMLTFAVLVGLGLYYRRRTDIHKRLVLLGTISLLAAPIARFPIVSGIGPAAFFGGMLLFVIACAVYDWRTRGRVHRATLWGGLFVVISLPLRVDRNHDSAGAVRFLDSACATSWRSGCSAGARSTP